MKKSILAIIISVFSSSVTYGAIFDWEHISEYRTSGKFSWNVDYDIAYFNDEIQIDLDLGITGPNALPVGDLWHVEENIENVWSRPGYNVNVDFVESAWDYSVNIDYEIERSNMVNWNRYDTKLAAHEIGHMFGLYDTYSSGAVDPITGRINTTELMGNLSYGTWDYYYDSWDAWLDSMVTMVNVPLPAVASFPATSEVPIPSSFLLFVSAIGMVGIMRKSRVYNNA